VNTWLRILLIWVLVLSPVWVGLILAQIGPYEQGFGSMFREMLGVAVICIVGLVVSILTRKRDGADMLSVVGYAVLAIAVCGYEVYTVFAK
jgi:hypothetical protein